MTFTAQVLTANPRGLLQHKPSATVPRASSLSHHPREVALLPAGQKAGSQVAWLYRRSPGSSVVIKEGSPVVSSCTGWKVWATEPEPHLLGGHVSLGRCPSLSVPGILFCVVFIYFMYFWLCWVFIAVRAFSSCSEWELFSSCGVWPSHCGGFSCCRAQALGHSDLAQ